MRDAKLDVYANREPPTDRSLKPCAFTLCRLSAMLNTNRVNCSAQTLNHLTLLYYTRTQCCQGQQNAITTCGTRDPTRRWRYWGRQRSTPDDDGVACAETGRGPRWPTTRHATPIFVYSPTKLAESRAQRRLIDVRPVSLFTWPQK